MKKIVTLILCLLFIGTIIYKINDITDYLSNTLLKNHSLVIKDSNEYTKNYDFKFVKRSNDYIPHSIQDLKDIIFSTLNNGWDEFTFYCPQEYKSCLSDMEDLTNDKVTFAHISNYVHPYNSYEGINTVINESGEITINITKLYTSKEINEINIKVDEIINNNFNKNDDDYTNLKRIHDYIINNTKYDIERNNTNNSPYLSYKAYGPALQGYATCNGYTDLMAIILSKLGYENAKVATTSYDLGDNLKGHVWNVVKIDGKWLHLDLTWDDPVGTDGLDYLYHKYFLVTKEEMASADDGDVKLTEHNFNQEYYSEFN